VASLPIRAVALQADVGDPHEAEELVAAAISAFGHLDVLVVNAGIWRGGRVDHISVDDWEAVLRTNLFGAFNVTRAAIPEMRRRGGGRIVYIGSVIGTVGNAGDAAYAAAKAGLVGLAKSVARETASVGITVNVVAPGFIDTDMTKAVSPRARDALIDRVLMKSAGRVEDVAKAVRYLVEDAPYVTGQVLIVDGGLAS
jgi:3-oxoacyl-[acyl-carrier protein] reductase